MAIFGKKKKKEVEPPSPQVIEAEKKAQEAKETAETNKILDRARQGTDKIDLALIGILNDEEFNRKVMEQAKKNDVKIERLEAARSEKDEFGESKNRLFDLEQDLYIGSDQVSTYYKQINNIAIEFREKSAAKTVATHANELIVLLNFYVEALKAALERGRALTANACLDVLRYTIIVGYRYEGVTDPEKLKERMDEKIKFISETGERLIETITAYYQQLDTYELTEQEYARLYNKFQEKEERLEAMPPEIRQRIDNLGFKRAMSDLPPGDEARAYLNIMLDNQEDLTRVYMYSMDLETRARGMTTMKSGVEEYLFECRKAFVREGDTFDYEAHLKKLREIRDKSMENMNRMNELAAASERMNSETNSLLKEIAENKALGEAVASASERNKEYQKLKRKNEAYKNSVYENRMKYKKEKLESERKAAALKMQREEELRKLEAEMNKPMENEPIQETQEEFQNEEMLENDF